MCPAKSSDCGNFCLCYIIDFAKCSFLPISPNIVDLWRSFSNVNQSEPRKNSARLVYCGIATLHRLRCAHERVRSIAHARMCSVYEHRTSPRKQQSKEKWGFAVWSSSGQTTLERRPKDDNYDGGHDIAISVLSRAEATQVVKARREKDTKTTTFTRTTGMTGTTMRTTTTTRDSDRQRKWRRFTPMQGTDCWETWSPVSGVRVSNVKWDSRWNSFV